MVHGAPDFGVYTPKSTVVTLEDLAEQAVRLGSIVNFDRKGDVVWFDDFEDGIEQWTVTLTGNRGSALWSPTKPRNGSFSFELITGATNEDEVAITKYFSLPALSRMGFEYHFTSHAKLQYIIFGQAMSEDTARKIGSIKYDKVAETWYYYKEDVGWVALFPTMHLDDGGSAFHSVKIVLDFTTNYYVSLLVDKTLYDLSSYPLRSQTLAFTPSLLIQVTTRNNSAFAATVYLDDVIVTQNEP